jgi:IclR family pca regulon transcriptional regulator
MLQQGASGWALLAFQSDKLIGRIARRTKDSGALKARIAATRTTGYSISHDELQLGVHGVAVPLRETEDRCDLSLGILVPSSRSDLLEGFVQKLKKAANEIVADAESRSGQNTPIIGH